MFSYEVYYSFSTFLALLIGFSCRALDINGDGDQPEVDVTRTDSAYLIDVYKNAPAEIRELVQDADISRLRNIYPREFAMNLVKSYYDLVRENIQEYPTPEFKIAKITNNTFDEIIVGMQIERGQLLPLETILPNQTSNIDITITNVGIRKRLFFSITKNISQKAFYLDIIKTKNKEVIFSLYEGKNKINELIMAYDPWATIYEIDITLAGENLENSTIGVNLSGGPLEAIKKSDLASLRNFVSQGINILGQDKDGNTLLHHAAQGDWDNPVTEQIFGSLLQIHPELASIANNNGETPLSLVSPDMFAKLFALASGAFEEQEGQS